MKQSLYKESHLYYTIWTSGLVGLFWGFYVVLNIFHSFHDLETRDTSTQSLKSNLWNPRGETRIRTTDPRRALTTRWPPFPNLPFLRLGIFHDVNWRELIKDGRTNERIDWMLNVLDLSHCGNKVYPSGLQIRRLINAVLDPPISDLHLRLISYFWLFLPWIRHLLNGSPLWLPIWQHLPYLNCIKSGGQRNIFWLVKQLLNALCHGGDWGQPHEKRNWGGGI